MPQTDITVSGLTDEQGEASRPCDARHEIVAPERDGYRPDCRRAPGPAPRAVAGEHLALFLFRIPLFPGHPGNRTLIAFAEPWV